MNRLRKEQRTGRFSVHRLDVDDLNDVEILSNRMKLGKGELSSIAFAKRTGQAFLTDDQSARKLASGVLAAQSVQTTPHLFGWLLFFGWISDSDKDPIIAEHEQLLRPLKQFFEEAYLTVLQYRAQATSSI